MITCRFYVHNSSRDFSLVAVHMCTQCCTPYTYACTAWCTDRMQHVPGDFYTRAFLFFENYAHIPCFVCDLVPGLMEWFRGHIWNVGQGDREGARCDARGTGRGHGVPIIFTGTHSLRLLVACWKLFSTARFDHSFRSMCARIFV